MSKRPEMHLFTGAGNNFVVFDGRKGDMSAFRRPETVAALCRDHRTDGLMILGPGGAETDFTMEFYNPDGSGGMMCGNGGRCIAAFADMLGIVPAAGGTFRFTAADGLHTARILSREDAKWTVRLKMVDVKEFHPALDGWFLNTGTRHHVVFVEDVEAVDVAAAGRELRWHPAFAPEGANVNFVQVASDGLHVRTFEKGVEGETLACGTGLTASAIAAWLQGFLPAAARSCRLRCRRGDWLSVDFVPDREQGTAMFTGVYLTGPAERL